MKRLLLTVLVLLIASQAASAHIGYIGLFIDEDRTNHIFYNPGGISPFEMWIWCYPGSDGMICAEFMIEYPVNVIPATITPHPDISVALGDLAGGISVCFNNCYHDYMCPYHQLCYVMDYDRTGILLRPHPDSGEILFANCLPGYPTESAVAMCHLWLNHNPWGVERSSWGAIKGMFE